jgi:hypothetical protein
MQRFAIYPGTRFYVDCFLLVHIYNGCIFIRQLVPETIFYIFKMKTWSPDYIFTSFFQKKIYIYIYRSNMHVF